MYYLGTIAILFNITKNYGQDKFHDYHCYYAIIIISTIIIIIIIIIYIYFLHHHVILNYSNSFLMLPKVHPYASRHNCTVDGQNPEMISENMT